ncbi:hypothetical protein GOODEAATRI_030112 [Goodea atripinnis]|uniref:Adenylosuccinate synthetase n=1 Tax=Goodea atripinnis TaxID=208336 RepID=A0ABV0NF75_9TELE
MANVNGQEAASLNGEPVVKRPRENVQQDVSLRTPKEPQNKMTVVLGAQWGDEGKGKVVDLLAMDADIVCRFLIEKRFTHSSLCPPLVFNFHQAVDGIQEQQRQQQEGKKLE